MIISENLLIHSGAEAKIYKKKDLVFQQGDHPKYYYQILKGNVFLNNYQEDGQEFFRTSTMKETVYMKVRYLVT